jgi:hypothetical protein
VPRNSSHKKQWPARVSFPFPHMGRAGFRTAIVLLSLAATVRGLPGQDIAAAKASIGRMKALPTSVKQVITVINGTNFGPFDLSGRCEYDWHWYCFGNCRYWQWTWQFPAYTWLKTDLAQRYNRVQAQANQFDQAFSPVRTWLTVSLPEISKQMEAASGQMQGADVAKVKAAVAQLDSQLNDSSGHLRTGYTSLSAFNESLNALLAQANSRDAVENVIRRDQEGVDREVSKYPCGADEIRGKYNNVRDTVRNQFNLVEQAGKSFGVTANQTDADVSLVLGTVLAARGSIAAVLKSLQTASVTPAGAVQQLRLNVVAGQWRDLANFAIQQLGN